jgi:hypothetical protein
MKKLILASIAIASSAVALAETAQKIDVKALPQQATIIDDVVVPVPSEIFLVLEKLGSPKWALVLRATKEQAKPIGEQSQIALQLGTIIAEGFIAVEAQNAEEVKKIGASVRKLAKALGVEKPVDKRANAIISDANAKDWAGVRKELDGAMRDVKDAMHELDSLALSQLISIGGWLRGTEALTEVVGKDFSKDGAELLHQPMLLDYFDKRLSGMPAKMKKQQLVNDVQKGLLEIRPLIGIDDGSQISEKSLQEVGAVTGRLIKAINSKGN